MSLKIGLVLPYDWTVPSGVREHIRHFATQLILMGHDVRILAPSMQPEGLITAEKCYNMGRGVPFPINGTVTYTILDRRLLRRVREVFAREHCDIIHIHEPLLPGLSLTALRASDTTTVGTFHAYPTAQIFSVPAMSYTLLAPFLRASFRRLNGQIAVSSVARQFVGRFFPADYQLIPNGIDLERFHPQVPPLPELQDEKRNILFVGRFDQRKGARYLVQAIPVLRALYPETRFLFVGEGHLRPDLQRYVQKQGWPDVLFPGYVSPDLLPRYFASAHVFCSPATGGESMGIVLLEAMASGVPVVATAIAGYTTVVEHGLDGLLTAPRRSDDLARGIATLLAEQELRQQFRMQGLEKVQQYAWPSVARRIVAYYRSLLTTHHGHTYERMSV